MRSKHNESKLQQACVRWFRLQYPKYLIVAIPNGGQRSAVEAAIMQAEGVTAGMPDLMILIPGRVLFVEMKYGKNKATDKQKTIHTKLESLNFEIQICYTFDDFYKTVNTFVNNEL